MKLRGSSREEREIKAIGIIYGKLGPFCGKPVAQNSYKQTKSASDGAG